MTATEWLYLSVLAMAALTIAGAWAHDNKPNSTGWLVTICLAGECFCFSVALLVYASHR